MCKENYAEDLYVYFEFDLGKITGDPCSQMFIQMSSR